MISKKSNKVAYYYNPSIKALLKYIGISPGNKSLVFFISLVAITIPIGHTYNSFAVICFVLFSFLSSRQQDFRFSYTLMLPCLLFLLMLLSLLWTFDLKVSAKALSKEASLLFIPLAFSFNRKLAYNTVTAVLKYFSLTMCAFGVLLMCRATFRFTDTGNPAVFFYNELASGNISIYLATFFSLALFVFLVKEKKTYWGYIATLFLMGVVLLLSKKSIIITDVVLVAAYYIFYSGLQKTTRLLFIVSFCIAGGLVTYLGGLSENWEPPLSKQQNSNTHIVTLQQAWQKESFTPNDNFDGPAFRIYRARVLKQMATDGNLFLTGCGLNSSGIKVTEVARKDNTLYPGWEDVPYNKLNFHNQYMEALADLGIFGLIIVLIMVFYNLSRALQRKYFIHIAFSVLMISLFLTESFLWRQKGVVFFTLFYCLFNDVRHIPRVKNSNKELIGTP